MSFIAPDILTYYRPDAHSVSSYPAEQTTGRLGGLVRTWRKRIAERQALGRLDQRDLRDIGLSRWEVENELTKPFWRD